MTKTSVNVDTIALYQSVGLSLHLYFERSREDQQALIARVRHGLGTAHAFRFKREMQHLQCALRVGTKRLVDQVAIRERHCPALIPAYHPLAGAGVGQKTKEGYVKCTRYATESNN